MFGHVATGHEASRRHTCRGDPVSHPDLVGRFLAYVDTQTGATDKIERRVRVLKGFTHHCTLENGVSS